LVAARRIEVPIVPGIFPIHSFPAVAQFATRCGATIPPALTEAFAAVADQPAAATELAADLAALQVAGLAAEGVTHVHLYTLNKPDLALAVCARLGVSPQPSGLPLPPELESA